MAQKLLPREQRGVCTPAPVQPGPSPLRRYLMLSSLSPQEEEKQRASKFASPLALLCGGTDLLCWKSRSSHLGSVSQVFRPLGQA